MTELAGELPDRADTLKHRRVAGLPVQAQVQDYDMTGLPLEVDKIHPHARAASAAAEAAAQQTDFWTMHAYLFEHQQALEDADLKRYAVELGLDSDRFARDRTSPEVENRIDRDLASGERSGVPGTPTFYVNGIRHDGSYDLESLRSALLAHIDGRAKAPSRHA